MIRKRPRLLIAFGALVLGLGFVVANVLLRQPEPEYRFAKGSRFVWRAQWGFVPNVAMVHEPGHTDVYTFERPWKQVIADASAEVAGWAKDDASLSVWSYPTEVVRFVKWKGRDQLKIVSILRDLKALNAVDEGQHYLVPLPSRSYVTIELWTCDAPWCIDSPADKPGNK